MHALCTVASRILFFWSCACGGWGEEDKRTRKAKQGKGNRKRDEEGKERKTQHYACRKRWRLEEKGSENRKTRKGEGAQEEKITAKVKRKPKEENGRKQKKEKARKGKRQKGRRGITKRRGGSEETSRTRTGKRTEGRGLRQRRPIRGRKKQDIGRKKEIWRYVVTKRTRNTQHTQTGRQTGRQAGAVEPAGRKANKISMSWQPYTKEILQHFRGVRD